jgi:hypothetical protein
MESQFWKKDLHFICSLVHIWLLIMAKSAKPTKGMLLTYLNSSTLLQTYLLY